MPLERGTVSSQREPQPITDAEAATPWLVSADLGNLLEAGVLLALNERLLWPLGLTFIADVQEDRVALDLREREHPDGPREAIALDPGDREPVAEREAFDAWVERRAAGLPVAERAAALALRYRP
jgi:hypothetical protein